MATELRGIKQITEENWLTADPAAAAFASVNLADGSARQMMGEDYLRVILRPQLREDVPAELQRLYEVARGAMVYGYFFYPLFTLASDQLFRVLEAAVDAKATAAGAPKKVKTFNDKIEWLGEHGVIEGSELDRWHALRELRNMGSHPRTQQIFTPGLAVHFLGLTAEFLNGFFSPAQNENSREEPPRET